jgi:hypothetical protein
MGKVERGILDGSGFEEWMRRREKEFCDEIEPVHVEVVDGENVVWMRRYGISEKGYFDFYHIGCDHLGDVAKGASEIQTMLGCSAVQLFLMDKAKTSVTDQIDLILPHFIYQDGKELFLDEQGEALAHNLVLEALVKTIEEPEICHGNIRAGLHAKPILQYMLGGIAESQVDSVVSELYYEGYVMYEDPLVAIAA